MTDRIEQIDCPAHKIIGGIHYCGLGKKGDLLCWVAHKRDCLFYQQPEPQPDADRLENQVVEILMENPGKLCRLLDIYHEELNRVKEAECRKKIEEIYSNLKSIFINASDLRTLERGLNKYLIAFEAELNKKEVE